MPLTKQLVRLASKGSFLHASNTQHAPGQFAVPAWLIDPKTPTAFAGSWDTVLFDKALGTIPFKKSYSFCSSKPIDFDGDWPKLLLGASAPPQCDQLSFGFQNAMVESIPRGPTWPLASFTIPFLGTVRHWFGNGLTVFPLVQFPRQLRDSRHRQQGRSTFKFKSSIFDCGRS